MKKYIFDFFKDTPNETLEIQFGDQRLPINRELLVEIFSGIPQESQNRIVEFLKQCEYVSNEERIHLLQQCVDLALKNNTH